MPNHCDNELRITGPRGDLLRFKDGLLPEGREENSKISFIDAYYPMPTALQGVRSPIEVVETDEEVDAWLRKNKANRLMPDLGRPISKAEQVRLRAEYGADNWYDWAISHWGTKWGDYDTEVTMPTSGRSLVIRFDSAWSPPISAIEYIANLFPTLTFNLRYWESGMGFQGQFKVKGEDVLVNNQASYSGPRGG